MVIYWLISSDMIRSFSGRGDGSIFFQIGVLPSETGRAQGWGSGPNPRFFSYKKIDGFDSPNIWEPCLSEVYIPDNFSAVTLNYLVRAA